MSRVDVKSTQQPQWTQAKEFLAVFGSSLPRPTAKQRDTYVAPPSSREEDYPFYAKVKALAERMVKGASKKKRTGLSRQSLIDRGKVAYRSQFPETYGQSRRIPDPVFAKIAEAVDRVIAEQSVGSVPGRAQSIKVKRAGIALRQKRGVIVRGGGMCSECHLPAPVLWKYSKSSHGEVRICGPCRDRILPESFGGRDALDHYHEGGAFEMNRRRH